MENKLFKFDWKVSIPFIIIGILLSMVSIAIIVGYPLKMYDVSHILLFLMVIVVWSSAFLRYKWK